MKNIEKNELFEEFKKLLKEKSFSEEWVRKLLQQDGKLFLEFNKKLNEEGLFSEWATKLEEAGLLSKWNTKVVFSEWNCRLQAEGLGVLGETPSRDALNPYKWRPEYDETMGETATAGPDADERPDRPIKQRPPMTYESSSPFLSMPEVSPIDPDLIARVAPMCDPRSGGVGGYGSKGLKAIRDAAGFKYNPSSFHAKMKNPSWDFVKVITDSGLTCPRSVENIETTAFYTNVASAEEAGRKEREKITIARQERKADWFTDPSSGSGK